MKLFKLGAGLTILVCALLFCSPAQAALVNGGFETGDTSGWTVVTGLDATVSVRSDGGGGDPSGPHSGSVYLDHYGYISDPTTLYQVVLNPDYNPAGLSMPVSFTAYGDSLEGYIQLSIWYSNDTSAPGLMDAGWIAAPSSVGGMVAEHWSDWDEETWDQVAYSATWGFEAKWFKIGVTLAANNCNTWVDDIAFSPSEAVPVPSAMLLLFSGLLFLVKKRRQ